jgi:hypothetical protein
VLVAKGVEFTNQFVVLFIARLILPHHAIDSLNYMRKLTQFVANLTGDFSFLLVQCIRDTGLNVSVFEQQKQVFLVAQ